MTVIVRGESFECRDAIKRGNVLTLYLGQYDDHGNEMISVFTDFSDDDIVGVSKSIIAPRNIVAGEYITIDGVMYLAIDNIPYGEPIIVGQNATVTTVEQQLNELKGE